MSDTMAIIQAIEAGKRGKRHPEHATVNELKQVSEDAYNELHQLQAEGKLRLGRTINSNYIQLITNNHG